MDAYELVKAEAKREAIELMKKAGIAITEAEAQSIEVADYGLNQVKNIGLQIVIYINTERVCAKEMIMLPKQTCPEHRHPPLGEGHPGKEETFRCRYGTVYLYVEGEPTEKLTGFVPECGKEGYTVFHEVVLKPGEQYTIYPNTKHWFQAGEEGAIVSEFSTHSISESDIFTDPNIIRKPKAKPAV